MSVEKSLELDVIIEQAAACASFSLGKKLVSETVPSFDPLVIRRDHARMKEALACVNHYGEMPFYGIYDLSDVLENASKGRVLTALDLVHEMHLIQGIRTLVSYERSLTDIEHPAIHELVDTLVVHDRCEKKLKSCINDYGEVIDSASSELKSIRSQLRHVDADIAAAANRFISMHGNSVVDSIVTYRSGRAVILVKASDKNLFGGLVYGDSASGQASYIEPQSLMSVNNRKQELLDKEQEEVNRILRECSSEVMVIAKEEIANIETCGILDAVFAKAKWGHQREACAAELTEEKTIRIVKAAHPLIDPKKVVRNTYVIENPDRMLLITGPNTGGKTVSMKIIGLFTLMTYCGMPVTCDSAEIPYFDRVFADIGDDQSVVSSLSSFSAHIKKQAEICRYATEDSLVLLDEVGSGTDPREGESLAIAILNDLREKKCMTVATTHYGRLKAYGKRHEDIHLASVQFDMEKLEPTYKYMEGVTGSSNAFEVAERYGLPKGIIKYARFLKDQARTREDELIESLEKQLNENELLKEELENKLAAVNEKEEQLKKEQNSLERQKDQFRMKAEKEAEEYVDSVRKEADAILKEIREREENAHFHEALETKRKLEEMQKEKQEKEDEKIPSDQEYYVGQAVELRSGDQVCQVIRIGKKDLTVLLNGREVRVKKNQIRPSMKVIPKKKPDPVVHVSASVFSSMPLECNLIGMHVDEAMETMDSYVDQAKVHGLKHFRIIHGDGSGALRKAVHQRLSKDKGVKSYRLGAPGEGGTGATVVELY